MNRLTARERTVVSLLACGLSNKEIGEELGCSEHTVKRHVSSVLLKTGTENRVEALGELGWIRRPAYLAPRASFSRLA